MRLLPALPTAKRPTIRTALALALCGGALGAAQANAPTDGAAPRPGRWDFTVTLDDRPIGRHRFELAGDPASGDWTLKSQADYDVKLLGLSVYTYRHSATERWRAGCLAQLDARTDDNGDVTSVQALHPDARGCLMSYAYWNPAALRQQSQLVNPQTGRLDAVQSSPLGAAPVNVAGQTVQAQGWRLRTPKGPVDIWTAPDGRWIGLDATVSGDRRLRYRLP